MPLSRFYLPNLPPRLGRTFCGFDEVKAIKLRVYPLTSVLDVQSPLFPEPRGLQRRPGEMAQQAQSSALDP